MYLKKVLMALVGFTTLAAAVPPPVERDITPAEKGLKHRTRVQKRNPLVIQETVVEQSITIIQNQNLGAISQLASIAEAEFAALVQSQIALTTQLEQIKNNIRVNHFRSRFSQVNSVIVVVTKVIDARDPANLNRRYLVNQLRADNGYSNRELLVMVTQAQEVTIAATPTLDLGGILGSVASASAISTGTAVPTVTGFDPTAPFGNLNGSMILPYNTSAPTNALVVDDPANIIFAGSQISSSDLFVASVSGFQHDCAVFGSTANNFLNLASAQIFTSIEAAAAAQLAGLSLGTAVPIIPPAVLANNPVLASAAAAALASQQAARSSSTTTATSTGKATAGTTTRSAKATATDSAM